LTKPFARADLVSALDRAAARLDEVYALTEQCEEAQRRLGVLTLREYQVVNELARGHPNKTIGYDFGISPRTVEVYRANVMRKLGLPRFADVLRLAFAAGMPLPKADIESHFPKSPLVLKQGDCRDQMGSPN
jgi:two-component system response regulator FixJ